MNEQETMAVSAITTGFSELDRRLGGGIPFRSLSLIEGVSDSGKSVMTQAFAHGALRAKLQVAYYTSENTVRSLIEQMASLGMDVTDHFLIGRMRIYPISLVPSDTKAELTAERLLDHVRNLPKEVTCIIMDSITNLVMHSSDTLVLEFFSGCKIVCDTGRSMFLVTHSSAFEERLLIRVRSLCDSHLNLRLEETADRLMKVLEVAKVRNAERTTGNIVTFDVVPKVGIKVLPVSKAKA